MDFRDSIKSKLNEVWEKTLAGGWSNDTSLDGAEKRLDNKDETVPGDTEFPTYDQLTARKKKMKLPQKLFTATYDEFVKENDNG